jgi:hypothetical protein
MSGTTTALTGRNGKFVVGTTQVARVTQWSVEPKLASSSEWGDSDTAGYTARTAGRRDCTFSSEGKYDTVAEQYDVFFPGDKAVAVLWMNATLYWDFPCALCSDFSLSVNIDSEEVIGWSSNWGADGIFYYPGQSGATTRTLP